MPAHVDTEPVEQRQHRVDVADARHVGEHELGVGQDRGRQDRQRAVLVAGGHDRSAQRRAALNDELLHRCASAQAYTEAPPRPLRLLPQRRQAPESNRRSAITIAARRASSGSTERLNHGIGGRPTTPAPFHPTPHAPYDACSGAPHTEDSTPRRTPRARPGPCSPALELPPGDTHQPVAARAFHPHHRARLRRLSAPRRPGAVLARPQHCITPLVRSAPCSRQLAGRR